MRDMGRREIMAGMVFASACACAIWILAAVANGEPGYATGLLRDFAIIYAAAVVVGSVAAVVFQPVLIPGFSWELAVKRSRRWLIGLVMASLIGTATVSVLVPNEFAYIWTTPNGRMLGLYLGRIARVSLAATPVLLGAALVSAARAQRPRWRRECGLCPWCGYSRAGLDEAAKCPECGGGL